MKKILLSVIFFSVFFGVLAQHQTYLVKTDQKFENEEFVYDVVYLDERVGEFWPVYMLNFVTRQTDPLLFIYPLDSLQKKLKGIAMAPDGMTSGSIGTYVMEGKALSHGRECGDGFVYNYGIIIIDSTGRDIVFTHKAEIQDFDALYKEKKISKSSLLFLPSIYRNGKYLSSTNTIEKVLIRRDTYAGVRIGIVIFDHPISYDDVRQIILGLDRDKSSTTHIYVLDGGSTWGQCSKKVNDEIINLGTRDISKVTNYLVAY